LPEPHEGSTYARWDQRPALGRRGMVVMVGVVVAVAAAAFGVVSLASQGSETQATTIRVPTSDWIPGQPGGDETIAGTLEVDERHCVYLESADGTRVWPVWPAGYNARVDDAGHVSLYDGGDHLVARDGAQVQATGGRTSATAYAGETCLPADGQVAVVQSEVTVTSG
jgi:hypothetical protein